MSKIIPREISDKVCPDCKELNLRSEVYVSSTAAECAKYMGSFEGIELVDTFYCSEGHIFHIKPK